MIDDDTLPLWISGLSLASVVAVAVSWRGLRRADKAKDDAASVNHRLLQIEEERDRLAAPLAQAATLRAEFHEIRPVTKLVIHNRGHGEARQVKVYVDGQTIAEHKCFGPGQREKTEISPGAFAEYLFTTGMATRLGAVRIEWVSESGEAGRWES